jgi:hypothetical protein
MRPLLYSLVVAIAWLCAATAPATAAQGTLVASPTFVPAAGPVLAGDDGVVWLRRRDDAVLDLWVSDAARGERRVQRFVAAGGNRLRALRLSASPAAVALELVELSRRRGARVESRSYRGALGQPLTAIDTPLPPLPTATRSGRFTDIGERRAVWVARACRSTQIRTIALPLAAPLSAEREPRCRLRLRRPARLRGGRLRFGVSCAGFAIDCAARVVVRARGRVIARGTASYNHATPPFAAASLRVTAAGLRLLRRSARTRMQISARINGLAARRATVVVARR